MGRQTAISKSPVTSPRKKSETNSSIRPSGKSRIMRLQSRYGNKAVQRMYKSGILQATLTVGQPGDRYEQEANRVSDRVMNMSGPGISRQEDEEYIQEKPLADTITPIVQSEIKEDDEVRKQADLEEKELQKQGDLEEKELQKQEKDEDLVQTKSTDGGTAAISPSIENRINSSRGGGLALPESSRAFFEPRFGADFSGVKVHTDSNAAHLSRSINAKAFTIGRDVFFGAGQYDPESSHGKRLMAHELTHVVQQNGSNVKASDQVSRAEMIQCLPRSRGDSSIRLTKPRNPPDIYVPGVVLGYDVDGELSLPWGLLSTYKQGGWYLEGVYGKNGSSKKFGSFHTVVSEGDSVSASDLRDTTKQGLAYLTIAAQLHSGWIEDYVTFQAYQHSYIKHPDQCNSGTKRKVFLKDVLGPVTNSKGRKTNYDVSKSFSQGWSASASTGTSYSQATSSSHGFNASLGGEANVKVGKVAAGLGYSYNSTDTTTITASLNNTMGISGSTTQSYGLHVEPGEVGALVPWGEVVAFKIPSIKVNAFGWVTDKTGHLVFVGMKVVGVQQLTDKIQDDESEADARARLQARINKFTP